MELAKEIINIVPPSEFFNAYNIIMKNLGAAGSLSTQAHVATGTATIDLPEESLSPRIHPTEASTMRKRSTPVSSPEGAASHPEEEDNIPKKMYKSTKLGPNQCPCGMQCTDREYLNNHIEKSIPLNTGPAVIWSALSFTIPEVPSGSITGLNTSKPLTGSVQKSTVIGDMKKNQH